MTTKQPSKNAQYFVFKRLWLKNKRGDTHFFIAEKW